MTLPADDTRQGLDEITTGLDRVRTSLAGFFTNATRAVEEQGLRVAAAEADAERFKADHLGACKTIADMYEAATGRTGVGPIRGVVEDVADMRDRAEKAEKRLAGYEAADKYRQAAAGQPAQQPTAGTKEFAERERARFERLYTREHTRAEQAMKLRDEHRRNLAAVFALDAETPFEEIREYAARNLTRSGGRLLASKTQQARNAATLQRVRDADTLADALTAVNEHDGLPPAAARAAANIAAAAEQPAAINAERERNHAIELAAARQARDEALRVANRAAQTLLRVKHARTAADAWTAIGAHFHMPSTDAGRGARRWRSTAEQAAEERAEAASVVGTRYLAAAERFQAAWQNARQRAQHATHREEMVRARAERYRQSRNRWTRQALDAADTLKRVRALLGTHLGPLATNAVRNALDTPQEG